jgi:hypothetical protein
MKFYEILKNVILEDARIDVLVDKFLKPIKGKESLLNAEELFALAVADPLTKVDEGIDIDNFDGDWSSVKKTGPYVQWIIKQYLNLKTTDDDGQIIEPDSKLYKEQLKKTKQLFWEDLIKVTQNLRKFDRFKNRLDVEFRNIDKLSIDTLENLVSGFSLEKEKATRDEKKVASRTYEHPGADIVYRGPKWTIVKISRDDELGRDAACYYGGNMLGPGQGETDWCTSPPGYERNFKRYISTGPLFVIIPNNPRSFGSFRQEVGRVSGLSGERYQFHFPDQQFMDANDKPIDLYSFFKENPELKQYFKPEFAKGLTAGSGKDLKIDGFGSGSVGKFVGLYGLEELFNSLPDTLEQIKIKNRDNDVIINIPSSITRFQNLKHLVLVNCVDSIPDYICQLNKLNILGVMDNPKLTSLPECLGTMESLEFINFKNTGVSSEPKSLVDNGWSEMETGMWDKFSQDDEV